MMHLVSIAVIAQEPASAAAPGANEVIALEDSDSQRRFGWGLGEAFADEDNFGGAHDFGEAFADEDNFGGAHDFGEAFAGEDNFGGALFEDFEEAFAGEDNFGEAGLDANSYGIHHQYNGLWVDGDGLCVAEFPTYWPANLAVNHGAICRNNKVHKHGAGWACPKDCVFHSRTQRPYCVSPGTTNPCTYYNKPKFNGRWWFTGGLDHHSDALCPPGYPAYWSGQADLVNKGAFCTNKGPFVYGQGWTCPLNCNLRSKTKRPFCVYPGTTEPCTYLKPEHNGKWLFTGELACPAGFPTYWPANVRANHGAVCRNKEIGHHGAGWICPKACAFHSKTTRPYCVNPGTSRPCTLGRPPAPRGRRLEEVLEAIAELELKAPETNEEALHA